MGFSVVTTDSVEVFDEQYYWEANDRGLLIVWLTSDGMQSGAAAVYAPGYWRVVKMSANV